MRRGDGEERLAFALLLLLLRGEDRPVFAAIQRGDGASDCFVVLIGGFEVGVFLPFIERVDGLGEAAVGTRVVELGTQGEPARRMVKERIALEAVSP